MTESELKHFVEQQRQIIGLELQTILYNEKALQLKFANRDRQVWMSFSLKPGVPYFFFSEDPQFFISLLKKPLALFLKIHFLGKKLTGLIHRSDLGRVVELQFSDEQRIILSFIPGRANIEAHAGKKSVFASRPKEIGSRDGYGRPHDSHRDISYFANLWGKQNQRLNQEVPKDLSQTIAKKQNGLAKMVNKLNELENSPWTKLGEWLKVHNDLENMPIEWNEHYNKRQNRTWNIENSFVQAKKNHAKIAGTQGRIAELEVEIAALQRGETAPRKPAKDKSLLAQAELRGKTVELGVGRLFIGKSGADNLKLLRKAKPWYLWLHIKDYPGAHGILEKQKSTKDLNRADLENAAIAIIKQSLPKGQSGSFSVIYTECRYVRPIKGASSGQVTYSHEKVLAVRV